MTRPAPVGILAVRDESFVVAVVASLLAGRGFVPLSLHNPPLRNAALLADCGSDTIVCGSSGQALAESVAAAADGVRVVVTDGQVAEGHDAHDGIGDAVILGHDPDALVYVIYTSGSTGRPKGVPITSANLMPLLRWQQRYFGLGPDTRMVQTLSLGFDFGIQEVLTTLCFGGTLVLVDDAQLLDLSRYFALLDHHRATSAYLTPSIADAATAGTGHAAALRTVLLGGEALSVDLVRRLAPHVPDDCVVFNGYGPTEASINVAMFATDRRASGVDDDATAVPIGTPTGNARLLVLNSALRRVPVGAPGELYIAGPGVASGYVDGDDRGAFVPDPFQPGQTMYRTGDRVRYLDDGSLLYLGRLDDQVKIHGIRLELGEVEAALRAVPGVADAAAALRRAGNEPALAAYLVASPGHELDVDEVRAELSVVLPEHAVPTAWMLVPSLGRTANGKLDRAALPVQPDPPARPVEPLDPTERVIAAVWESLLGVSDVRPDDSFFERGGSSLTVVSMHARLQERLGFDFPLAFVLEARSVRHLARLIVGRSTASAVSPAQPRGRRTVVRARRTARESHDRE